MILFFFSFKCKTTFFTLCSITCICYVKQYLVNSEVRIEFCFVQTECLVVENVHFYINSILCLRTITCYLTRTYSTMTFPACPQSLIIILRYRLVATPKRYNIYSFRMINFNLILYFDCK